MSKGVRRNRVDFVTKSVTGRARDSPAQDGRTLYDFAIRTYFGMELQW